VFNSAMDATQAGAQARLRALVEAGIALSSELSLDAVLQKLVEAAAELTGARYAALGVIDQAGRQLERFVTTGIDAGTHAKIGDLPRGRGILGLLIREARPVRIADLGADPRSVGFPEHHPPMKTFLGVPILLRGVAFGNLYLTEKEGGAEFTQEDEDLVTLLAAQAAVAIENARLYESATRWLRQLESLNEVGNALASELDAARLLDLIATRTRELVGARVVSIALPTLDGALRIEAAAGEGIEGMLGRTFGPDSSKTGRVFGRAHSERVDSVLQDPEVDQSAARAFGIHAALYVPLLARGRAIGVLVAHDREGPDPRFTDDDLRLAETFAARAAIAVNLAERVSRDAMRRVVEAQELERKRLARELHDETGQALTSIILGLRIVDDATSDEERREALRALRELVLSTLNDVRRLAVELRPKALDDFGLVPALERLSETFQQKSGIVVHFEAQLGEQRLPPEAETALYRIVQEALTNVAKHAGASNVSVLLTRKDGGVVAVVEDDGRGLAMRERVSLLGGRLALESAGAVGTTLVAEVPV
jgi:two-component system, NarL family, sensor histidine kinase DevS